MDIQDSPFLFVLYVLFLVIGALWLILPFAIFRMKDQLAQSLKLMASMDRSLKQLANTKQATDRAATIRPVPRQAEQDPEPAQIWPNP